MSRLLALPAPLLTTLVASLVDAAVDANDLLSTKGTITRFHAKERPPLKIDAYLDRLITYTPYPRDALLLSLLYIDRISRIPPTPSIPEGGETTPLFPSITRPPITGPPFVRGQPPPPLLNSFTVHRLLAASLLCASRFTADGVIGQRRAAKVGGVDMRELVRLEVEILKSLEWNMCYTVKEMEEVGEAMLSYGESKGLVEKLSTVAASSSSESSPECEAPPSPRRKEESEGSREDTPTPDCQEETPISETSTARTSLDGSDRSSFLDGNASPHRPSSPTPPSTGPPSVSGSSDCGEDSDGESTSKNSLDELASAASDLVARSLGSRTSSETVRRQLKRISLGPERGVGDVAVC
ncbi:hypothetical protein T439DRAFT_323814 [Meredithblackwellia eburnea MCA 4105]